MKFRLLTLLIGLTGLHSLTLSAQRAADDEPRWFEVEVVVYKSTKQAGFNSESWDDEVTLNKSAKLIDFVHPYHEEMPVLDATQVDLGLYFEQELAKQMAQQQMLEAEQAGLIEPAMQPNELVDSEGSFQDNSNPATASTGYGQPLVETAEEEEIVYVDETPFTSLSEDALQLTAEVRSLKRHPDYQVLVHQAWRQPVLGSSNAEHVRIAGGEDFSDRFLVDGSKIIEINDTPYDFSFSTGYDSSAASNQASDQASELTDNALSDGADLGASSLQAEFERLAMSQGSVYVDPDNQPMLPRYVRSTWVPELDGDIQVYLGRYLHIKTNLYLRRPGQQEVEAAEFDLLASDKLSGLAIGKNTDPFASLDSDSTPVDSPALMQQSAESTSSLEEAASPAFASGGQQTTDTESQFSWELDDNFLDAESEKLYIEKLFNYPLKQSRRVRSGELHFFDHPLVGVLVIIRPYERPIVGQEVEDTATLR